MNSNETVINTVDRFGRAVRYRRTVYERHLPDRPEMADYLEEAANTINDPDLEYQEEPDNGEFGIRVYYKDGLGRGQFEKCLLKVPVHYDHIGGEVATFHFTRRVGRGEIIWQRGQD